MASITLEPRPAVAGYDWRSQDWLNTEHAAIRRMAEQAGRAAYAGPGWSNTAIRREAQRFLQESVLLSPHQGNLALRLLVEQRFFWGWRGRERKEQGQP